MGEALTAARAAAGTCRVRLRLGISTCPNDTFAFHAVMERQIDMRGLEFEFELQDVQELNDGLFAGRYDVPRPAITPRCCWPAATACSAPARRSASASARCWWRRGPASGRRPTPACSAPARRPRPRCSTGACTPDGTSRTRVFSDIGAALRPRRRRPRRADPRGPADLPARRPAPGRGPGRILRARWPRRRSRWAASSPGSTCRRTSPTASRPCCATRSPTAGRNRDEVLATIRRHAQELDEDVIWPYVELYVTEHTVDLGDDGIRALERSRARRGRRRPSPGTRAPILDAAPRPPRRRRIPR